jgi:dTDP-glucose pyrophosphorylase
MKKKIEISPNLSILDALKYMDTVESKLLIVMEINKFIGLISIGDIQRAIIKNLNLDSPVKNILRGKYNVASPEMSIESIKALMFENRMELCPIVTPSNELIDVIFWDEVYKDNKVIEPRQFNLPVVIMAGGFGTRLKPLTNVLPKPLIPIGSKTMLEEIFERFTIHGCDNFFVSINYKAELIEYYLESLKLSFNVNCFKEETPSGTAGSLSLLKDKINSTFFVSNCDILIEQDYSEILEYHYNNKNDITVVAALKHYRIPYGTIETSENGKLEKLSEKPELTFKINSGMYILEPNMLEEIPKNKFFHITHLIEKVKNTGGKVGVFPVSEKSWKDIGEWDEYIKNNKI